MKRKEVPQAVLDTRLYQSKQVNLTIQFLHDKLKSWVKAGHLKRTGQVYLWDAQCLNPWPAQRLDQNVSQIIDHLAGLIKEEAGEDGWQFDSDDGWHDPVCQITAYRGGLYIGYGDSYQDELD
jgi:hypothetical protein